MPSRRALLVAGPLLFLAVFFVWPVAELIARGLGSDGASVGEVFTTRTLRSALWFTFWQAALSTLATLLIAFPLTAVVANVQFRGRALIRALVVVPFVLPTVVVAGAFVATNDRLNLADSAFALRRSVFAIIAAHVFFNIAVIVRTVGGYWSQLARDPEHAARTLGTGPVGTFFGVTLRRLRPALTSAAAIVFLFSFTSFGVVLILGGTRQRTLETEIYRYAVTRTDFGTAAVLSIVQLLIVGALVALNLRLQRRLSTVDDLTEDRARRPSSSRQRVGVLAAVLLTLIPLAIPIAVLVERSLIIDGSLGFDYYDALLDRPQLLSVAPGRALLNSIAFALVATAISTVIGSWAAAVMAFGRSRVAALVDVGYLLPLGTSAVTLGFGILLAFDVGIADIRQSWIIIPLAQSLVAIPFVVRAVAPVLRAIDPALREAAATMGADRRTIARDIDLPIARRALAVGAGFAFAISMGEFGATSFVGRRPDLLTVPLAIERLLGQPGDTIRGTAMAASVVLMIVTTTVMLIVDRRGRGGVL